jgi:WD40 repeat protein
MNLGEKIANDFGAAPESAFAGVLRRLETDPAYAAIEPAAAVPLIFGTLATARRGLSADEIARLLCNAFARDPRDPVLFEEALDTAHLILRQVRPFLARRGGRHDFFYDAFRRAALARYVGATRAGARTEAAWHTLLADYFHTLPLWRRPAGAAARTPDERRVGELPYHLTLAGDGKRLGKILGDLDFIEAKCHAGLTYELLDDYLRIPEPLRTDSLDQFREFVRAQAHVLKQWPELTFQQAANTVEAGTMYGQSAPAKASVYRQLMGMESRPWLRRLNPAPTAGACVMTMSGHDGSVLSVTVSPTGERAISVGVDATLRIWDLRTGSAMETLRDVVGKSPHLAPIPGSTRIAVWGKDSRIVVWDYSVLQPIAEFAAPRHGVSCLSADATGHFLVAGTDTLPGDKTGDPVHSVVVCDLQTGLPVDIGPFTRPTSAVAIANGGRVLYAASGNKLEAYDTRAKRMTAERTMQTEQITSVRLAPDEASLATCGWGGVIETWSADSLAPIRSFSGSRQGIVWAIAYSPDGREIAAAGLDGTIVIWDIATGKSITRLRGHTDSITAISYTPEGSWLVTCGADGTVRLWDPQFDRSFFALARQQMTERFGGPTGRADPDRAALEMETLLFALSSSRKHFNAVLGVTAAASGRRGVSVSLDDTIRIWNMETGEFVHVLEGHENGVAGVTASADGQRIATSDRSGTVKVWDVESGEELATRSMVGGPAETKDTSLVAQLAQETRRPVVLPLRFVAGGKLLATADSLGHAVKIWDAETLEPYLILAGHTGRVRSLMTGDHKMTLVSSGDDGAVIAWNLDSGEISARLEVPIAANVSAQAAPICMIGDGRVACAWPDGSIRLFNPGTMASTGELRGSEGRVRSLSAAADLIVATRLAPDGVVIDVWRGAQAAPVHIERCGSGSTVASLHADTRRLAIVGPDGLLVRDLDDKRALRRYPVQVSCAAFAGQRVIAAGAGISGEVYLLEATG